VDIFDRKLNRTCHESVVHAVGPSPVKTPIVRILVCFHFEACKYKRGLAARKTFLGSIS
jgi:hypothetical protein